jgi:DUF1009 family protein
VTGVALIAGRGALPRLIAEHLAADGVPYHVAGFEGQAPDWLHDHPHTVAPFEKLGRIIADFRRAQCGRLCMAGGLDRPRLNPLRFDTTFARFAPRVLPRLKDGDDAALSAVASFFESEGFEIVAADSLLPGALVPAGVLAVQPGAADTADIARAIEILETLAPLDIGQGCVVAQSLCLGIETLQGTDTMLDMVASRDVRPDPAGARGVLVKRPKQGQDRRVDLPSVGPDTCRKVAAAGLAGIAVEADGALLIDRDTTLAEAERLGLFVVGVRA